jgi:hypothetical protein
MKSNGPRRDNPTPAQGNPGNQETTKSFKELENEGETTVPSNTDQGEEGRGVQIQETGGTSKAAEGMENGVVQGIEEGEISHPRNGADQGIEEGEISLGNETGGTSEAWDTPK